jgi:glycosyltransferase involved in cell wall biosynthesis
LIFETKFRAKQLEKKEKERERMSCKISVITVVRNGEKTLEQTILSVLNQTYSNIEYIIIDGASTDGTVDIIKRYERRLACWISEPDKGIYDAMNKGIDKATGVWTNFMNSGDYYYNNDVISSFVGRLSGAVDVFYGDTLIRRVWGDLITKPLRLDTLKEHIPFCHQSCFTRTDLLKRIKFDLRYKICADYNFYYNLYQANMRFFYIPLTVSVFEATDGVSSSNTLAMYKECCQIAGKKNSIVRRMQFKLLWLYIFFRKRMKKIILHSPVFIYYKHYKIKYTR